MEMYCITTVQYDYRYRYSYLYCTGTVNIIITNTKSYIVKIINYSTVPVAASYSILYFHNTGSGPDLLHIGGFIICICICKIFGGSVIVGLGVHTLSNKYQILYYCQCLYRA